MSCKKYMRHNSFIINNKDNIKSNLLKSRKVKLLESIFLLLLFMESVLFISIYPVAAQEPDSITFKTQVGEFRIPRTYLVTQAALKDGALVPINTSFAFQIEMPDGKPVNHDYGLEGLPNVDRQGEVYPVVVNEVSSENQNITHTPERLFANTIVNMDLSGVSFEFRNGVAVFQPEVHPDSWFIMYYQVLPPIGNSGRVSALFRCSSNTSGLALPSACDGWEFAEGLHLLMHIRFPRLKTESFNQISERIIQKLNEWKIS